ncbi:hypothetical protein [Terribacillus saccharophilus]|nr:hypothetical protein [Terribacillus saccharophilus]
MQCYLYDQFLLENQAPAAGVALGTLASFFGISLDEDDNETDA